MRDGDAGADGLVARRSWSCRSTVLALRPRAPRSPARRPDPSSRLRRRRRPDATPVPAGSRPSRGPRILCAPPSRWRHCSVPRSPNARLQRDLDLIAAGSRAPTSGGDSARSFWLSSTIPRQSRCRISMRHPGYHLSVAGLPGLHATRTVGRTKETRLIHAGRLKGCRIVARRVEVSATPGFDVCRAKTCWIEPVPSWHAVRVRPPTRVDLRPSAVLVTMLEMRVFTVSRRDPNLPATPRDPDMP